MISLTHGHEDKLNRFFGHSSGISDLIECIVKFLGAAKMQQIDLLPTS